MVGAPAVAFLRPRLGIGGSERLAIDAAIALKRRGCQVRFFIPGSLTGPQFNEVTDGTLAVETIPTHLPEHMGGALRAPLAIARTATAARALARAAALPDLVFCDVVSHVVPLVKRLTRRPVLFFCHFPDRLLVPESRLHQSLAYRTYRRPLDWREVAGLLAADRVVVNSAFTAAAVHEAFPGLGDTPLTVVHPGVPVSGAPPAPIPADDDILILSVSRFDPRKGLALAVAALADLRARVSEALFARVRLVLAGRYDESLPEQGVVLNGLRDLAARLGVSDRVQFVLSPTSEERDRLFARCRVVIYTPSAEHFGYVPLEAMAAGRPVVASNHGGPTETVVHGRTGLLCPAETETFAEALATFVNDRDAAEAFGRAGRGHVEERFSTEAFGERLWAVVKPWLHRV